MYTSVNFLSQAYFRFFSKFESREPA